MTGLEAFVQGVGEGAVPVVLEPIVAVQILIGFDIADEAGFVVLFGQVARIRGLVSPVLGKPLQLRGVAHDERPDKVDGVYGNVGIHIDHVQVPHAVDIRLVVIVDD